MISERIKELREQNGYTQTTLAKKLGLSRSAINAWEMGLSVPSTQYLVELSKLFRISTDYILGLKKEEEIDISDLKWEEKEIIYALLKHFQEAEKASFLLKKHGIDITQDYTEQKNRHYHLSFVVSISSFPKMCLCNSHISGRACSIERFFTIPRSGIDFSI